MSYALDLSSSWAKLERAKVHIDQLQTEIGPHPHDIPLWHEYDDQDRAIVWRVQSVIEIRDNWPLLVGDAIHNLRGALDHLAWQLAIRSLAGVEPTDDQARNIQFPIETDPAKWVKGANRYLTHMAQDDIDFLKRFQPLKLSDPKTHGLFLLNRASNIDKHRRVALIVATTESATLQNPGFAGYVDCVLDARVMADGSSANWHVTMSPTPRPNEELVRVFVIKTGPNPDVELHANLTGYVAFGEHWNLLDALDRSSKGIGIILKAFEPEA